jgi:hypothetical protein
MLLTPSEVPSLETATFNSLNKEVRDTLLKSQMCYLVAFLKRWTLLVLMFCMVFERLDLC